MTAPLTQFLTAMLKADRAALARADSAKLAAKYGISQRHAAGYLAMQISTGER